MFDKSKPHMSIRPETNLQAVPWGQAWDLVTSSLCGAALLMQQTCVLLTSFTPLITLALSTKQTCRTGSSSVQASERV